MKGIRGWAVLTAALAVVLAGVIIFSGCSSTPSEGSETGSAAANDGAETVSCPVSLDENAPAAVAYGAVPETEGEVSAAPILEAAEGDDYYLESEPGGIEARIAASPSVPAESIYSVEISQAVAVEPVINALSLPKDSLIPLDLPSGTQPGPMAEGKLVTLKSRSEPCYSYFDEEGNTQKSYPLEVAIFDLATRESTKAVCTVEAIDQVQSAVSLDGQYAYLYFTPLANTVMLPVTPASEDPVAWEDYNSRLYRSSRMVLQINMQSGSLKQFPLKISGVLRRMTPLGNSNLLLEYTSDPAMTAKSAAAPAAVNKSVQPFSEARIASAESGDGQHYEYMDLLDLTTGKITSFYVKEPKSMLRSAESKFVEMSFVSASEERVYFKTSSIRAGNVSFGYRVYDTSMNFIDGKEVDMLPQSMLQEQYITANMSVQKGKLAYCISGVGGLQEDWHRYYQFTPVTGGYDWEPYSFALSGQPLYTVNPRKEPYLDYDLVQFTDEGGSWLSISNPTTGVQFLAALNAQAGGGFTSPEIGVWQPVGNYSGDFLVKGRNNWFLLEKESLKATIEQQP